MMSFCEHVLRSFEERLSCNEVDGSVTVDTPFRFPDGDHLKVHAVRQGERVLLTDAGEVTRWLTLRKNGKALTDNQNQTARRIARSFELTYAGGELHTYVGDFDEAAQKVTWLSQCGMKIAEISRGFQQGKSRSFKDEVAECFTSWDLDYSRQERVELKEDCRPMVDFKINRPRTPVVADVVSQGSKSANEALGRTLTKWLSFERFADPGEFEPLSILDDRDTEWSKSNRELLEAHSQLIPWSKQSSIRRFVGAVG